MSDVYRMTVRLPEPSRDHVERAAALEGESPATWAARVVAAEARQRLAKAARDRQEPDPDLQAWWAATMPAATAVRESYDNEG